MKHLHHLPGALALGIAGGVAFIGAPAHAQLARVTATERLTEKRLGTALWQKAARGEALGVGDGLRTGRRSKADLKFADGSLLRLGQLSTVELKSAKGASLTGGRLLFSMLKPGRVLAGTAAAEIKGSVGIISINNNGSAEFTLYSGAMDVVTARETVSIPPGQAMTVFSDGSRSVVHAAPPLRSAGSSTESSLLEAPSEAPFMGSRADLQARFSPDRLAIDSSAAALKQRNSSPFPSSVGAPVTPPPPVVTPPVVTPPVVTPPVVTPPVVTPPVTPPIVTLPTIPPVVTPPTIPPVVTPPTIPPVVTPPTTPPVVTPPPVTPPIETPPVVTPPIETPPVVTPPVVTPPDDDGKNNNNGDKDNNPNDGNNGKGNDDKGNNGKGNDNKGKNKNDRVLEETRFFRSNITAPIRASESAKNLTPSFTLNGMALRFSPNQRVESPRLAMASPDSLRIARALPAPPPIPPGTTAEEHILQSDPGLGRNYGVDSTGVTLVGERGTRVVGGRLRAIATRGRVSAEVALSPTQLRFGGGSQRRFTLSDASLTMRLQRGNLQVGRQRFLSGPALATGMGSMVRQGGRQVMDAVTFRPTLKTGNFLELAYINDAFVRDLPFRVRGRQQGFYGRFGVERRAGNFGLNVLNLSNVPSGKGTGVTLDFALPVVRDSVEFYGEIGQDPLSRSLRTLGLAFPGLQTRTGVELYLEQSVLGNAQNVLESPDELALLAYKPLRAGVFLTGGYSHFSDGRNLGTFGLAFGARSSGQ